MPQQPLDFETIKAKLSEKSNEDLIEILSARQDEYTANVIPILKNILIERGYAIEDLTEFDMKYVKIRNKIVQSTKPSSTFKIRYVLFGLIGIGLSYGYIFLRNNSQLKNSVNSKDSVWSKTYKDKVYQELYKASTTLLTNEEQKRLYTACELEKLQQLLPKGLESIPSDSVNKILYRVATECGSEIKNLELSAWSPVFEKIIKTSLIGSPILKKLNEQQKQKFCNCYILKLKKNYPKGIKGQVPSQLQNKIGKECADELLKN